MRHSRHIIRVALTIGIGMVTAVAFDGGTSMAAATPLTVQKVLHQAHLQKLPHNVAQAREESYALVPAVRAALAADPHNASLLLATKNKPIAGALLVVQLSNVHRSSPAAEMTSWVTLIPQSSGCWSKNVVGTYNAAVYDVSVTIEGWCGNGRQVTSAGNVDFHESSFGIYCLDDTQKSKGYSPGPLGAHQWYDASITADTGMSYVFGCATLGGIGAYAEVEGNGYSDGWGDLPW